MEWNKVENIESLDAKDITDPINESEKKSKEWNKSKVENIENLDAKDITDLINESEKKARE